MSISIYYLEGPSLGKIIHMLSWRFCWSLGNSLRQQGGAES